MTFSPRCPTCRQPIEWEGNAHRPFCSERCRLLDLGAWASERYRIPGAVVDPDADDDPGGEEDSG
jgi:uncharacterized protein